MMHNPTSPESQLETASEIPGRMTPRAMRDRSAVADFLIRYGPLIRRRVRGRLSAGLRRIFDSQDILSTVARRLDSYVARGAIGAETEAQLLTLIQRMADAALVDKVRMARHFENATAEDGPLVDLVKARLEQRPHIEPDAADAFEFLMSKLDEPGDRHMLLLWLNGVSLSALADDLGISDAAARQRWHALRQRLRRILEAEASA